MPDIKLPHDSEEPTRDVEMAVDQRTLQGGSLVDLESTRKLFRTDLEETERLLRPAEFKAKDGSGVTEVPLTCDRIDASVACLLKGLSPRRTAGPGSVKHL
jgi:hypothetical protein